MKTEEMIDEEKYEKKTRVSKITAFISCRICAVFLIDSHFMVDGGKFISGAMAALSVMVNLEVPHVNVLSKV